MFQNACPDCDPGSAFYGGERCCKDVPQVWCWVWWLCWIIYLAGEVRILEIPPCCCQGMECHEECARPRFVPGKSIILHFTDSPSILYQNVQFIPRQGPHHAQRRYGTLQVTPRNQVPHWTWQKRDGEPDLVEGANMQTRTFRKLCGMFCGPRKATNICHPGVLQYRCNIVQNYAILQIFLKRRFPSLTLIQAVWLGRRLATNWMSGSWAV